MLFRSLERALLVSDGRQILPEDLPAEIRAARAQAAPTDLSIPAQVAALERTLIARALEVSEGNKSAAARALEISYKTLLYKIREYGLEP